jgi:1,4-dihydroxy-2-naphthoate octaprenyltransferase
MLVAAFVIPLYFYATADNRLFTLVPLVIVTAAVPVIKTVFVSTDGEVLNGVLAKTGKLLLLFSIIFSLGWIL